MKSLVNDLPYGYKRFNLICLGLLIIAGCEAGSGEGLDERGLPVTETTEEQQEEPSGSEDETQNQASLEFLQANVFGAICSECHQGGGAPLGLRLDSADNAFQFLVDVDSGERPDLKRVNPGNPDESYIVMKVEGDPAIIGGRMPLNRTPLSADLINALRDWIANGAPRDNTSTVSGRISRIETTDDSVNIRFSKALAPESVGEGVSLYANTNLGPYWVDPADVEVSLVDQQQLSVRLNPAIFSSDPLVTDLEIVLGDGPAGALTDTDGLLVDADQDGLPGGQRVLSLKTLQQKRLVASVASNPVTDAPE